MSGLSFKYTQEQYVATGKFVLHFGLLEDGLRAWMLVLSGATEPPKRELPFSEMWTRARKLLAADVARDDLEQLEVELHRLADFRNEMFHSMWLPRPTDAIQGSPADDPALFRALFRRREQVCLRPRNVRSTTFSAPRGIACTRCSAFASSRLDVLHAGTARPG